MNFRLTKRCILAAISGLLLTESRVLAEGATTGVSGIETSKSVPLNLDLSSSRTTIPARTTTPVNIFVGANSSGSAQTINSGQLLTPAQCLAVNQVLAGKQTLSINPLGQATGGFASITSAQVQQLSSINVPRDVSLIALGFGASNPLSVNGTVSVLGSLFALQNSPNIASTLEMANLYVGAGALLSGNLPGTILLGNGAFASRDLTLNVLHNVSNMGTISSPGNLTINAGGSISNALAAGALGAAPIMQAFSNVNLNSAIGSFVNSGSVVAQQGNINFACSGSIVDMTITNAGGKLEALNGAINLREELFNEKVGTVLIGGDWLSQQLNVWSGKGAATLNVGKVSGALSVSAGALGLNADTPELHIGELSISGDPFLYNSGSLVIDLLSPVAGACYVIVAGGNITGSITIDTASATGNGGNVVLVAGANNVSTTSDGKGTIINENSVGATGGFISLSSSSATLPTINTVSTAVNGNGGDVTLVALPGSLPGSGTVTITNPNNSLSIATNGSGTGRNGDVIILAGAESNSSFLSGNTIVTRDISTGASSSAGSGGGGSIRIQTGTPGASSGNPVALIDASSSNQNGTGAVLQEFSNVNRANGSILTENLSTSGSDILLLAGSNSKSPALDTSIVTGSISTSPGLGAGGNLVLLNTSYGVTGYTNSRDVLVGAAITTAGSPGYSGGDVLLMASGSAALREVTTGGGRVLVLAGGSATAGNVDIRGVTDTSSSTGNGGDVVIVSMGSTGSIGSLAFPYSIITNSSAVGARAGSIVISSSKGTISPFSLDANATNVAGGDGGDVFLTSGSSNPLTIELGAGAIQTSTSNDSANAGQIWVVTDSSTTQSNVGLPNTIQNQGLLGRESNPVLAAIAQGPADTVTDIVLVPDNIAASQTGSIQGFSAGGFTSVSGSSQGIDIRVSLVNTTSTARDKSLLIPLIALDGGFYLDNSASKLQVPSSSNAGIPRIGLFSPDLIWVGDAAGHTSGTISSNGQGAFPLSIVASYGQSSLTNKVSSQAIDLGTVLTPDNFELRNDGVINIAGTGVALTSLSLTAKNSILRSDSYTLNSPSISLISTSGSVGLIGTEVFVSNTGAGLSLFASSDDIFTGVNLIDNSIESIKLLNDTIAPGSDGHFFSLTAQGSIFASDPSKQALVGSGVFLRSNGGNIGGDSRATQPLIISTPSDNPPNASFVLHAIASEIGSGGVVNLKNPKQDSVQLNNSDLSSNGTAFLPMSASVSFSLETYGNMATSAQSGFFTASTVIVSPTITLSTTSGSIGTAALPLLPDTTNLSVQTSKSGSAYISQTAKPLNLIHASVVDTFDLTVGGDILLQVPLNSKDISIKTTDASNGSITVSADLMASNNLTLSAGDSGSILQTAGTIRGSTGLTITALGSGSIMQSSGLIAGGKATISSVGGDIGAKGAELQLDLTGLVAKTSGSVFLNEANSISLINIAGHTSKAGGTFELTSAGDMVVNSVQATNILLRTAAGSNGNITVNSDATNTQIVDADGSGNIVTKGWIKGLTVSLSSDTGNIGVKSGQTVSADADNLSISTAGTVFVVSSKDTVNLYASKAGGTFNLVANAKNLNIVGDVSAQDIAISTHENGNATIDVSANISASSSVSIYAAGKVAGMGIITQSKGVISAPTVDLMSDKGDIGSSGAPIQTAAQSLSANTSGTGSVYVKNVGAVALKASSAAAVFDLNVAGDVDLLGQVSAIDTTIQTAAGSNGNINLAAGASASNKLTLTADGSGAIARTAGLLSGATVSISSGSGSIGSSGAPIQTASTTDLSANTGGNADVFINESGSVNLLDSKAGGTFDLTVGAAFNLQNALSAKNIAIRTTEGGINIALNPVASNSLTLAAGGIGSITQTVALISAPTLNFSSTYGDIGYPTGSLQTASTYLSANTVGAAAVSINAVGGVSLRASSAGTSFDISASGDINLLEPVSAQDISLSTAAGTNGKISIAANAKATNSLALTADGSGSITQTSGLISGTNVNLLSSTGSLGSSGAALQTDSSILVASTGGTGDVFLNEAGTVSLASSKAGGTFDLTVGADFSLLNPLSAPNIAIRTTAASNGSINIGTSSTTTSSMLLSAGGSGAITQSLIIAVPSLKLVSGSGSIGNSAVPLQIAVDDVSAKTSGSVGLESKGAISVGASTAGAMSLRASSITVKNDVTVSADLKINSDNISIDSGVTVQASNLALDGETKSGTMTLTNSGTIQSAGTLSIESASGQGLAIVGNPGSWFKAPNVTIISDQLDLTGKFDAGASSTVVVKPQAVSTVINLAGGAAGLNLSAAELSNINTDNLEIGSSTTTGGIVVNSTLNITSGYNLRLLQGAGSFTTTVGALHNDIMLSGGGDFAVELVSGSITAAGIVNTADHGAILLKTDGAGSKIDLGAPFSVPDAHKVSIDAGAGTLANLPSSLTITPRRDGIGNGGDIFISSANLFGSKISIDVSGAGAGNGGIASYFSTLTNPLSANSTILSINVSGANAGTAIVGSAGNLSFIPGTGASSIITAIPSGNGAGTGNGANIILTAGTASSKGSLLISGALQADGANQGAGGSITLNSNSATAFALSSATANGLKGASPILSVSGAGGAANGSVTVTNRGGGITNNLIGLNNVTNITFDTSGASAGKIIVSRAMGGSNTNSINLMAGGSGSITATASLTANFLSLTSGTGLIRATVNTSNLAANTGGTAAVILTNNRQGVLTLNTSSAGGNLTVKNVGKDTNSGIQLNGNVISKAAAGIVTLTATGTGAITDLVPSGSDFIQAKTIILNTGTGSAGIGSGTAQSNALRVRATNLAANTTGVINLDNLGLNNTLFTLTAAKTSSTLSLVSLSSVKIIPTLTSAVGVLIDTRAGSGSISVGSLGNKSTTNSIGLLAASGSINATGTLFANNSSTGVTLTTGGGAIGKSTSALRVNSPILAMPGTSSLINVINLFTGTTSISTALNASSNITYTSSGNTTFTGDVSSLSGFVKVSQKSNAATIGSNVIAGSSVFLVTGGASSWGNITALNGEVKLDSVGATSYGNISAGGVTGKVTVTQKGVGASSSFGDISGNVITLTLRPDVGSTIDFNGDIATATGALNISELTGTSAGTTTSFKGSINAATSVALNTVGSTNFAAGKNFAAKHGTFAVIENAGLLSVGAGATLRSSSTDSSCSITLLEKADVNGAGIFIGNGAQLLTETNFAQVFSAKTSSVGQIALVVGATIPPKIEGTQAASNVTVDLSQSNASPVHKVYFGNNSGNLIANGPTTNTLKIVGSTNIQFSPGAIAPITLDGGTLILADPPPFASASAVLTVPNGKAQPSPAASQTAYVPVTKSAVLPVQTPPAGIVPNQVLNTANPKILQGGVKGFAEDENDSMTAVNAIIENDEDLRGLAHTASASGKEIVALKKGNVIFTPSRNTRVETLFGDIDVDAKSVAMVFASDKGVAVFNLDDSHRDAVRFHVGSYKFVLAPGRHLLVTSKLVKSFEQVNTVEAIGHRNLRSMEIGNGFRAFSTEFSIPSAITALKSLRTMLKSKTSEGMKLRGHLLKTVAAMFQTKAGTERFQQYQRPYRTAFDDVEL